MSLKFSVAICLLVASCVVVSSFPVSNCSYQEQPIDVYFVVDGSGSVGRFNFEIAKKWIVNVTETLDIDNDVINVGVIQYSHWYKNRLIDEQPYIHTEIQLGSGLTQKEFTKMVEEMELHGFSTYTAHALEKVGHDFKKYSRQDAKKIVILLTDGEANDAELLEDNSRKLREEGIATIAIGIGAAREEELRIIASGNPESSHGVYDLSDFEELQTLVENLGIKIVCNEINFPDEKENDSGGKELVAEETTAETATETTTQYEATTEEVTTAEQLTTNVAASSESTTTTVPTTTTTEAETTTVSTTSKPTTTVQSTTEKRERKFESKRRNFRKSSTREKAGTTTTRKQKVTEANKSPCAINCGGWFPNFQPLNTISAVTNGCYNTVMFVYQQFGTIGFGFPNMLQFAQPAVYQQIPMSNSKPNN